MSNSTCFDCSRTPCTNFGTCAANSICSCPDGWGFQDCSKPLCGSLAQLNSSRPIVTDGTACQCTNDFDGPNCNVCQSDGACAFLPQSTIGTANVCNKSPVAWSDKHFTFCGVKNTLLSAAYSGVPKVTLNRNSISESVFATLWIQDVPQFSCTANSCSQTFNSNLTSATWACQSIQCVCQPGTQMCGGSPVDISSAVNKASGPMSIVCSDPANCKLKLDFIKTFFPIGISLTNCNNGECADKYLAPIVSRQETSSSSTINTTGISSLAVFATLILLLLMALIYGLIDRAKQRNMKIPKEYPGTTITFSQISYRLPGRNPKQILSNVSGSIQPGQILAIMGPSGSGKTTFLDILAGKRQATSGHLNYSQMVKKGYVDQEDIHLECLSVRETVLFSACSRLPEAISLAEKNRRVDEVLKQLGLSHVADSRVGCASKRGISGGEKKRLSIAVELVTNPAILFVDEPTSGLDSYNALQVIQTLSALARLHHKTVVFTVHQPNSRIYALFDRILLLSRGTCVYFGNALEAETFCDDFGMPCPANYHIADHLLDFAATAEVGAKFSVVTQTNEDITNPRRRKGQKEMFIENVSMTSFAALMEFSAGASSITQLQMVLTRSWKVFFRNPLLFVSHLVLSVGLGVFIGMLYYQVDNSLAGIQNRLGSIFFIQALLAFGGLSAISSLSEDRVLFVRQRSNGFYGSFPYFVSKVVFDLIPLRIIPSLILCSLAYFLIGFTPTADAFVKFLVIMVVFSMNAGLYGFAIACMIPETSTSVLAAVMSILFQMLFAGILVNQVQIPIGLRWIQYLSLFKYAYEGCIANEVAGLMISSQIAGINVLIPANLVLSSFGLDPTAYYRDVSVTLGFFVFFLTLIAVLMSARLR